MAVEKYMFPIILIGSLTIATTYVYLLYTRYRRRSSNSSSKMKIITSVLPVIVAATAGVLSVVGSYLSHYTPQVTFPSASDDKINTERIIRLELLNQSLEADLRRIDSMSVLLKNDPTNTNNYLKSTSTQLALLTKDVTYTKEAIAKFEGLLITDAERIVSLPLLKKDIESIHSDITSIREQVASQIRLVEETQAQGRWIIGTLGLGILALVVPLVKGSFTTKREPEKANN